jgi:riboflavin biosynthesis pyrimidine reductase
MVDLRTGTAVIRGLLGPMVGREDLDAVDIEEAYAVGTPTLRTNLVLSLDGVVAVDGVSAALGGPADAEVFATLRALADVVVVAAGTARAEHYGPAWLGADRRRRRVARGQPELPVVAVVSSDADLDPASRLFTEQRDDQPPSPRPLVLTTERASAERVEALREVADVVRLGADQVDLAALRAHLVDRGLGRVLCEGGPGLLTQLLVAGLVDDLCLTYSPLLAGPGQRTLAGDPDGAPYQPPVRVRLTQVLEGDGLLLTRYSPEREAAPG